MSFVVASRKQTGFTLLEVMLVLLIIGLATSVVMYNAFGANQSDRLKEEVARIRVLLNMASDYAILNQQEMGLRIDELDNRYVFMILDKEDIWREIPTERLYAPYDMPEQFSMTLTLDDLPWQTQDQFFDRDLFDETLSVSEEGVEIGEEDVPPPPPQILIMSSGEITPFSLSFNYEPDYGDDSPTYFTLNNIDVPPFEVLGPLETPPL